MRISTILAAFHEDGIRNYVGRPILSRNGKARGTVTGTSFCRLDGCGGLRLHVRWKGGKRTYPCSKGCKVLENGDLRITCVAGGMSMKKAKIPTARQLKKIVLDFIEDIESTGGVRKVGWKYELVADLDWTDLALTYVHACQAIGRKPKVEDE